MKILITGGASGLGKAIVELLAKNQNNTVYFTYNSSVESAQQLAAAYKNTSAIRCNFTKTDELQDFLALIGETLQPEVLINNAFGHLELKHFYKTDSNVFSDSFATNVMPVLRITQKVMEVFRRRKQGKIITIISSVLVNKPPVGWSVYAANKAYLLSMVKSWAVEGAAFNVSSVAVSPSLMQTKLSAGLDERIVESMSQKHPLNRHVEPQEVAELVVFLVSASAYASGANIIMNGGESMV